MEKELKEMVEKLSNKVNDISLQSALYRQITDGNSKDIDKLNDIAKDMSEKYNSICQSQKQYSNEVKMLSQKIDGIIGFFKKVITPLVTALIISYIIFQLNLFKASDNDTEFIKKIDKIMTKYNKGKDNGSSN